MSKLAEFRAIEKALQEQLAQLDALKKDTALKKEIEFEKKLLALMETYDKGLRDIIDILEPSRTSLGNAKSNEAPRRQPRQYATKVYTNPETGEVVKTRGGNHKMLKDWKQRYGAETVESWLQA